MCERIKTIKQCYKALEYEINKQEALKKISTLHLELKFKDNNDFSDRFTQTVSIIENNLSVFQSASDHVDIITTILNYLHTINVKVMFDNQICTADDINVLYMMFLACQDFEIPLFLRMAIIDNSRLENEIENYTKLISNYIFDMIVLEDADLYAIINYLKSIPFFLTNIRKFFVQEFIKEKFLSLLEKNFEHFYTFSEISISTFRIKKELLEISSFNFSENLYMISVWSEDIMNAKVLASTLRRDIIFINSLLEFCPGIDISSKWIRSSFTISHCDLEWNHEDGNKISPNKYIGSVYNLFYDGTWQKPVKGTYWIHDGNTYANATKEDILKCINSAKLGYETWSNLHVDSRRKILQNFADILECNGKFLLTNIIKKWIRLSYANSSIKYDPDKRLEVTCFNGPKGYTCVYHDSEIFLFGYLTLTLLMGNSIILLCNQDTCNLVSYFNMFSTAEMPPGIVNLLLSRKICKCLDMFQELDNSAFAYCASNNYIIVPLK